MKRRIVFATGNENKMKEIRMILADLGMEIVSMKEAGVDEEIIEDGMTFEENAEIKARTVSRVLTNDIVLADDSGLEIDYLDKAPLPGSDHMLQQTPPAMWIYRIRSLLRKM